MLIKGVEGNSTLVYELTLVKFEKAKESWQVKSEVKFKTKKHDRLPFSTLMHCLCVSKFLPLKSRNRNNIGFAFAFARVQLDAEQKLEQARIFKEKGTKHFKASFVK